MKILLVDDSRTTRRVQLCALAEVGLKEVCEAEDGVEALHWLGRMDFELLIVDWNMPNMDGLTLVQNIRGKGNRVPILMCTTEAERPRVIEAIKAGVNDYITKPFENRALQAKVLRFAPNERLI